MAGGTLSEMSACTVIREWADCNLRGSIFRRPQEPAGVVGMSLVRRRIPDSIVVLIRHLQGPALIV